MKKMHPDCLPPLPNNLQDAHDEIRRLQRALYNERLVWMAKLDKAVNDHQSAVGELKKFHQKLKKLKEF